MNTHGAQKDGGPDAPRTACGECVEEDGATERAVHPALENRCEEVARPLRGRAVFPGRLYHAVPSWVSDGSSFHIRIRCDRANAVPLTDADLAPTLLNAVRLYEEKMRWFAHIFLLMPDHLHALLTFPRQESMSRVIGDWKRFHRRANGVIWQENYFDHRIRNDAEFLEKTAYIRRNPVMKGLCQKEEEWPWVVSHAL